MAIIPMELKMFRVAQNLKILNSIIELVAIQMMYVLISGQRSAKMGFHDISVLINLLAIRGNNFISTLVNGTLSVLCPQVMWCHRSPFSVPNFMLVAKTQAGVFIVAPLNTTYRFINWGFANRIAVLVPQAVMFAAQPWLTARSGLIALVDRTIMFLIKIRANIPIFAPTLVVSFAKKWFSIMNFCRFAFGDRTFSNHINIITHDLRGVYV